VCEGRRLRREGARTRPRPGAPRLHSPALYDPHGQNSTLPRPNVAEVYRRLADWPC
jgi:hypothetical protein